MAASTCKSQCFGLSDLVFSCLSVVTRNPGHDLTHTSCVQWLVKYAVWVFAHMKKIIEETQELSLKESSMGRYDFDQEVNCLVRQTMCVMLKEAVALHVCDESGEMKLAVPQVSQIINQRMPPKYMDYLDIGYQVLESQIPPGQGIAVEWRL